MGGGRTGGGSRGSRRSNDGEVNGEGRRLCRYLGKRGWGIMNGNVEGDEEGEWTYTGGRGNSMIDYVVGNEETRERVERMEVAERIDPDHHPVVVWLRGEVGEQGERRKKGGGEERGERETGQRREGRNLQGSLGKRDGGGRGIEEEWAELKERVKRAMGKAGDEGRGETVGGGGTENAGKRRGG